MQPSDRLLLLVGSNPLPNAIAAYHLLAEGGTAILLHTEQTRPVAGWLANRQETWGLKSRTILIERATPHSIYTGVLAAFRDYQPGESVGLHYTGGTKSMAVHAYRAFLFICEHKGITPTTSYLDAGTLRIEIDHVDPSAPGGGSSIYTGEEPALPFDDLMRLHGWRLKKGHPVQSQPRLPGLASALGDAYARYNAHDEWSEWKKTWKKQWAKARNARGSERRNAIDDLLAARTRPLPASSAFEEVRSSFSSAGFDSNQEHTFGDLTRALGFGSDPVALGHWLDGTWLESLVLGALKSLASKWDLHDVAANLYVEATGTFASERERPYFEFDVAAMRGSQLFAFSCSTDTGNARLKTKLFEAQMRARQFGGDQARVALVCPHNKPEVIQAEARNALRDDRLRVFGQRDLRPGQLYAALDEWIGNHTGTPS